MESEDGEPTIESADITEANKAHDRRRIKWQTIMLSLSFISYCSVHMQREMWSISKPKIKNNPKFTLDEDALSIVDTVNFFVYGLT